MRQLDGKIAVVVGGSRGLGQGIVRALAAEGAAVWTLARDAERLDQLKREVAGVQTLVADVTDPQTAPQTLRATRPDILVLGAGATPTMAPVHQQSWEQFSRVWETDVHMTFSFGKEALLLPLAPGSVVVTVSVRRSHRRVSAAGSSPCSRTRPTATVSRSASLVRGWHRWMKLRRLHDKVQADMTTPLLSPALARARAEFEELVKDIRPELHRYCARMIGSVVDAEDVVQDALAKAFYALPTTSVANMRGWLFRIAHNKAIDHLRRSSHQHLEQLDEYPLLAEPDPPLEEQELSRYQ